MSAHAIAADYVFDGWKAHEDAAIVIDGSLIATLQPRAELASDYLVHRLPAGAWLAPGFIDLQVNGGGDVLFNDSPTPETILTIAAAHRSFGTTAVLPTFITDTREKTRAAIAAAQQALRMEPGVLGIHLEGPHLSPEKPGVHDPSLMRAPDDQDLEMLCSDWEGSRLITLAPECVPKGFIAKLVASGWHVSLGHSAATYGETCVAMAEGLSGFTHLFNAMRPLSSREPGPIAAALETPGVWYGLIVDGHHVSPPMLRLALRGVSQPMLVTDAMSPVGGSRSSFQLYGRDIHVAEGTCRTIDGTLAGTALDMATAVRNCVKLLQVSLPDALRFASTHPAEFIGLGQILGKLAPGYRADLVAIDAETFMVLGTWVAGAYKAAH
jgi:N-acetylglucosamine-6-phosphate deacetylase